MLNVVLVEALAALSPEMTSAHHLPQQWRGPVFILSQLLMKPIQYSQERIEPNQVSQSQWTDWMVRAQDHCVVDVFS